MGKLPTEEIPVDFDSEEALEGEVVPEEAAEEAVDLDELAAEPRASPVPVVRFGGAAKDVARPPALPVHELPDFTEADVAVLEDLERLAQGGEANGDSEKVKPARMVATLIRLLIRKGVIHELEFLEELARK